jgi:hypothetical protein
MVRPVESTFGGPQNEALARAEDTASQDSNSYRTAYFATLNYQLTDELIRW